MTNRPDLDPNAPPTAAELEAMAPDLVDLVAHLPPAYVADALQRSFRRHRLNNAAMTSCSFGDAAQNWFVLCAATPARVREVEEIVRSLSGVKDKIDPIADVLRQQVAILEAENRRLREQLDTSSNHPTRGH